jgi:hypothetical protein
LKPVSRLGEERPDSRGGMRLRVAG